MSTTPAPHTFTADQAVLITLDPRRAPRPGFYVEDAPAAGKVTVRYEVQGKGERFADVAIAKVAPAAPVDEPEVDAPAVDDVPVVDVDQAPAAIDWDDQTDVEIGPDHADLIEAQEQEAAEQADQTWDEGPLRPEFVRDDTPAAVPASVVDDAPAPTEHTADVRDAATAATPARKGGRTPKRAPLREGYTTPVGLAKLINERGLYTGGKEEGLSSQALYGYIKSAPASAPFPGETLDGRFQVNVEAGLAWWTAKNERAATRRVPAKVDRADLARQLREALLAPNPSAAVGDIVRWLES